MTGQGLLLPQGLCLYICSHYIHTFTCVYLSGAPYYAVYGQTYFLFFRHVCIGYDEFTPSNVLRPNNDRKTMALNFSFIELGQDRLWHDESWFTPVLVRCSIIAQVPGGWSSMLRAYIQLHFFSSTGIATAGLPLMLNGAPFLLFAKLSHVLADGEGLRSGVQWKGAAGLKCCIRHWNVLKLNTDLMHRSWK